MKRWPPSLMVIAFFINEIMSTIELGTTEKARKLLEALESEYGKLIFHLGGGCCDGTAPQCFQEGELYLDDSDILIGYVCNTPLYMNKGQYGYWQNNRITIDVVEGRGSSFSLELPLGVRFIVKSGVMNQPFCTRVKA